MIKGNIRIYLFIHLLIYWFFLIKYTYTYWKSYMASTLQIIPVVSEGTSHLRPPVLFRFQLAAEPETSRATRGRGVFVDGICGTWHTCHFFTITSEVLWIMFCPLQWTHTHTHLEAFATNIWYQLCLNCIPSKNYLPTIHHVSPSKVTNV